MGHSRSVLPGPKKTDSLRRNAVREVERSLVFVLLGAFKVSKYFSGFRIDIRTLRQGASLSAGCIFAPF